MSWLRRGESQCAVVRILTGACASQDVCGHSIWLALDVILPSDHSFFAKML